MTCEMCCQPSPSDLVYRVIVQAGSIVSRCRVSDDLELAASIVTLHDVFVYNIRSLNVSMYHVMHLSSVPGITMFGMPLIRDI